MYREQDLALYRLLVVNHKQKSVCLAGTVRRFEIIALLQGFYDEFASTHFHQQHG